MSDYLQPPTDATASGGGTPPPPPAAPVGGSHSGGGRSASASDVGFFGALFDFSFARFITPMIVKAVYMVATIIVGLAWVIALVAGFANAITVGLFVLTIGAAGAIIYLAFIRMTLEFFLAIVRMSEDVHTGTRA